MNEVIWTSEQSQAISVKISNTIVSAGAGSGKTAVLTERIFNHLCNGIDIENLLILTFTKAAAASMKEKTKKKIEENKGKRLKDNCRKKQLDKIDGSYIMTFDAFALSLVKKYHYLLNVSNNISVVDENVMKLKQQELLEEILNDRYRSADKDFLDTINDLTVKNDNAFKEAILSINDQMDLIIDRESFGADYFKFFFSTDFLSNQVKEYRENSLNMLEDIKRWFEILEDILSEYNFKFITTEMPKLKKLVDCKTVKDVENEIIDFHLGQLSFSKDVAEETSEKATSLKNKIARTIGEIQNIFTFSEAQLYDQIKSTEKYVKVILDIVGQLDKKSMDFKKEKDLYSYTDIAKMSIQVVKENEIIRNEIKNYFREILVDEYQDNSDLQEEFINLISNNNVFVVGDIKQSIYGFRNANPLNFQKKYEKCKSGDYGKTIDLNKNFRSREEVVETVNIIFGRLMDRDIGGVNYDESQKMQFGQDKYSNHCLDSDYRTEIISYELKKEEKYYDEKGKEKTRKVDVYPFADKEYSKEEVEAQIIASDIKNKIKDRYKVCDDNRLRDVRYGDFCIMAQTKTHFDLFNKILSAEEIPVKVEREVQIGETDIINVIKRIFMMIDNIVGKNDIEVKKHCYASIERSFLFQSTDERIYETIEQKKIEESESYLRCARISQGIQDKTIREVFNEVVKEFEFYEKIHLIGEVELNVAIIEYVGDLAVQLGQIGYSYSDFAVHLERILSDGNNKFEFRLNQTEDNAVKIMSIHNSKGLEFKICYYPMLFGEFNTSDTEGKYLFSKERGIILPCKIYQGNKFWGLSETVLSKLFKKDKNQEMISERIRLLYVALTRAKEKIIMVCPLEEDFSESGNGLVEKNTRLNYKSFLAMLNSIVDSLKKYIRKIDLKDDISLNKKYLSIIKNIFENLDNDQKRFEVKGFNHIIPQPIEKGRFSKEISLIDQATKDVMEYGTKLHYLLEVMDFKKPDYSLADKESEPKVRNFIESELLKDVADAVIRKEFEFIYQQDNQQKHGFIDLLLEYDDRLVIIDYKLKNISDENYDQQLLGYKKYLESVSDKKVECYLYSLIDSEYRQVK